MPSCICITSGEKNGATLYEGGHFYASHGPTLWSKVGWELVSQLRQPGDHTTLLIDDVHPKSLLNAQETNLPVLKEFHPDPCFTVKESEMAGMGMEVLEMLKQLQVGRRHRALHRGQPKRWMCSGFPLTTPPNGHINGDPLCLLYDLGLTLFKYRLGFRTTVNVLPAFYESEQYGLIKIARKIMSDLELAVVLYDLDGSWRWLRRSDVCGNGQ